MTSRKTVPVDHFVKLLNQALAVPDSQLFFPAGYTPSQVHRAALATIIETVLMYSDNYKGFKYQSDQYDQSTGMLKDDFDSTRRQYFERRV